MVTYSKEKVLELPQIHFLNLTKTQLHGLSTAIANQLERSLHISLTSGCVITVAYLGDVVAAFLIWKIFKPYIQKKSWNLRGKCYLPQIEIDCPKPEDNVERTMP